MYGDASGLEDYLTSDPTDPTDAEAPVADGSAAQAGDELDAEIMAAIESYAEPDVLEAPVTDAHTEPPAEDDAPAATTDYDVLEQEPQEVYSTPHRADPRPVYSVLARQPEPSDDYAVPNRDEPQPVYSVLARDHSADELDVEIMAAIETYAEPDVLLNPAGTAENAPPDTDEPTNADLPAAEVEDE